MERRENGPERQRISDLFPVRREAVRTTFDAFLRSPVGAGIQELDILLATNPHALRSFQERSDFYPVTAAVQALWGNLLGHRILREEAIFKGGVGSVPPQLTERFVQDYETRKGEAIEKEFEEQRLSMPELGAQIHRRNLVTFRNFEPEASEFIESERGLARQPEWNPAHPEDNYMYQGIIDTYLLFREGCSNPQNYQQ